MQNRTTLLTFLLLLTLVLGVNVWMIGPYILALVMGGILAMLTYPAFTYLKNKKMGPKTAATLTTTGIVLLVIIPITTLASLAIKQGISIAQSVGNNQSFSMRTLVDRINGLPMAETFFGKPEEMEAQIHTWIQQGGKVATDLILKIAAQLPEIFVQLALASLTCFFLLIDGEKFLRWVSDKIPIDRDVRMKLSMSFRDTAISVIWATLAAALTQSCILFLAFLILGVPSAFLAGGATFILAWIPLVGSAPVGLAGALYLYSQDQILKVVFMILFTLFTGVVDNFVRPMVLKGRGNMHPLISLVAIFGGIGLFGILGVFMGPILAAVLISLLQIWPTVGMRFGLLNKTKKPDSN